MTNLPSTFGPFAAIDLDHLATVSGGDGGEKRRPTVGERINRTVDAGNRWATPGMAGGAVVGGVVGGVTATPTGPGIVAGVAAGAGVGTVIGGALGFAVGAGGSIINQLRGH